MEACFTTIRPSLAINNCMHSMVEVLFIIIVSLCSDFMVLFFFCHMFLNVIVHFFCYNEYLNCSVETRLRYYVLLSSLKQDMPGLQWKLFKVLYDLFLSVRVII